MVFSEKRTRLTPLSSPLIKGGPRGAPVRGVFLIFCLAFVFSAFTAGCSSGKAITKKAAYSDSLNKWTRSVTVYEGLEPRLYLNATYKDKTFRDAYTDRYAEGFELPEAYRSMLLEREAEASEQYNEFFLTVYSPDEERNDLDAKNSVWRLFLEDSSGARLTPVNVTRLDPADALLREFFPFFDPWSRAYIVKFPKYSETGREPIPGSDTVFIKIIVTGLFGKGELVWRLKD
ncbi:MAG: hypothetical protein HY887_02645 [Deltaproteobacteria bacterium]|nr:hypothetical protein [Deltaproteobacteria bacterium]